MLKIIFVSSSLALVSWSPAGTLISSLHLTQRKQIAEIKQGNCNCVPLGYKQMYAMFASIFEGLKERLGKCKYSIEILAVTHNGHLLSFSLYYSFLTLPSWRITEG